MSTTAESAITAHGMFDLRGRLAVVTGANRGIGFAMAEALALAGADIVGVSRTLKVPGSEIGAAVERLGRRFTGYQVDLLDRSAVQELCETLAALPWPVDILVNNAGVIEREPATTHGLDAWDRVLQVDLWAPFVLAQAVGRSMLERGSGKVIFTASLLSFQGGIHVPSYTAAKSAVMGLTKALANEWAGSGVNVNAIVPGYIETDNTMALREDAGRSAEILRRIPAGRWGCPADLGGVAVFLASDAAAYVHGATIAVDGGWLGR